MGEDFERLLKSSGEWGRYQKIIVVLIGIVYVPMGFTVISPVFIYHVPAHRCYIREIDSTARSSFTSNRSTLEGYIPFVLSDDGSFEPDSCARFIVPITLSRENSTKHNRSEESLRETEKCVDGWVYMDPDGRTSISTELNLVCNNAWKRPLLTSSLMIGILLGSIVCGPLTDKFGRRKVSLINTLLSFLSIFASGFAPTYELIAGANILVGMTHIILFSSNFVLAQELVGRKHRAIVACTINVCHCAGNMLLSGVAYLLTDWRWMVRGLGVSFALFLTYIFFLPESPRWFVSKGLNMEAYKILRRIARCNGKNSSTLDDQEENNLDIRASPIKNPEISRNRKRRKSSVLLLVTNASMRTRSLLICLLWNVTFLCYFTFSYNTSNLGGNNYWNCFIAAAVEVPSYFFTTFSVQKFGRRFSAAAFIGLVGFFSALSPALGAYPTGVIVFAMIGKFFAACSVGILYLYTSELYPTLLRNTGIGIASTLSRVGCMLAPFLIFAGENGDRFVPFYVMAILGVLTAILCLFLPETKHSPLPDTIMDAVAMDRDRTLPFISKRCRGRKKSQVANAVTMQN